MKADFVLLIGAAVMLLLPSCRWNIGERIRSESAVHVGADTRRPVEGKVYASTAEPYGPWYCYAPEVTYRVKPDWAEVWFYHWEPRQTYDVTPTGRSLLVRYHTHSMGAEIEAVDALPEDAVLLGDDAIGRHWHESQEPMSAVFGSLPGEQSTRGSVRDQLLAAPFDYVIDPVLSVVSTPIFVLYLAGDTAVKGIKSWF